MTVFVGWDVGAWNCDQGDSRDALCAVAGSHIDALQPVGASWRGNLRAQICERGLAALPTLLGLHRLDDAYVVAIDAPLGWPEPFVQLVNGETVLDCVPAQADKNPYLFRRTDLRLFDTALRRFGGKAGSGFQMIAACSHPRHRVHE